MRRERGRRRSPVTWNQPNSGPIEVSGKFPILLPGSGRSEGNFPTAESSRLWDNLLLKE